MQETLELCQKSCRKMLAKTKDKQQLGFFTTFEEQLNRQHPLYILSNRVDWKKFEDAFRKHYCENNGAPAKPIRLMVGLIILKHIRNLSDESVVEQWAENAYYQYFAEKNILHQQNLVCQRNWWSSENESENKAWN